jgi:hypothetical protein
MVMGLTTALWVAAQIRLCDRVARPALVVRRGDADAGAVLLKVNRFAKGCVVFVQATTMEGESGWMRGTGPVPVAEPEADAYIERQVGRDSDIWVVEIEDREGTWQPDGKIV